MIKTRTGFAAILATVAMLFAMVGLAAPAQQAWADDTGTITIVPPTGTASDTTTEYKIYKVFDATVSSGSNPTVSYKLLDGKATTDEAWTQSGMGTYFSVDAAGNVTVQESAKDSTDTSKLSSEAVTAIGNYVTQASLIATYTKEATGTTQVEIANVSYGYWYVTTQTGSAVSIGTNNPNARINDKNVIPLVDKKITAIEDNEGSITSDGKAAIATVGKKVTYTATVDFNNGSKVIAFHDTMGSNLSYNNDAKVAINKVTTATGTTTDITSTLTNPYTIATTPDTGDTLTINFADGLDKQASTGEHIQAVITYTATVTSDALTVTPENNAAYVTYGDNNAKTDKVNTYVYNAKIVVTKIDGSNSPLAGASFKLYRTNASGQKEYYKYTAATDDAPASVSWVIGESEATELTTTSGTGGNVLTFTGLPDGTYTLTETVTPAGYNTAADQAITINGVGQVAYTDATAAATTEGGVTKGGQLYKDNNNIENLNKVVTVVNNAGSALPHTGGPGTVLMYIIGAALVIAAGVALIVRRKMSKN